MKALNLIEKLLLPRKEDIIKAMMDTTIAAIATGDSACGIAIIRMSGKDSLKIIDRVFKGSSHPLSDKPSHTIHYGHIYNNNKIIDEVLVNILLAPRSYTTENTVEINCHGGILNTKRVLEVLLKNGAILAKPGEFTKRAFLNGRIDLSEAEAVIDIINADNNTSLNNAIYQLSGTLSAEIKKIRQSLIYQTAKIEAALDDPEHYDLDLMHDELLNEFLLISNNIDNLLSSFDNGRILQTGIRTVILGKPNVGKSSLLNRLSGYETAIVTDIAGTTRDLIKEKINIDTLSLNLIDTAGIRDTDDVIEKIGIEKSIETAKTADLLLIVIDSSKPLEDEDISLIRLADKNTGLIILNKIDLNKAVSKNDIKAYTDKTVIELSLKEDKSLKELENTILELFGNNLKGIEEGMIITSLRQKEALKSAADSMKNLLNTLNLNISEDLILVDAMSAYTALGDIIGEHMGEDLINTIFDKFCMGK